jgi:serine/threonine protein kinase
MQVFARKILRLFGQVTEQDIENEAKAVSSLCTNGECKQIVEVLQHGWLTKDHSYYFIDMEYCQETLEDRLRSFSKQAPVTTTMGAEQKEAQTPKSLPSVSELFNGTEWTGYDGWGSLLDALNDILLALDYIHKKKFVRRDLKPRNGTFNAN